MTLSPEITDKPGKYKNVTFHWDSLIINLPKKYIFLSDFTSAYIYQDKDDKSKFHIVLDSQNKDPKRLLMSDSEREEFEVFLLTLPQVVVKEIQDYIMYFPSKAECDQHVEDYNELIDRDSTPESHSPYFPEYGPVIITKGEHKGRIGFYDCESDNPSKGIVFFGDILLTDTYSEIIMSHLSNNIPTISILERMEDLSRELGYLTRNKQRGLCVELLLELRFIENLLFERYISSMYLKPRSKIQVFISHATNDLTFARSLATDLAVAGFSFFLADWSINLGENIILRIEEGLEESSALVIIVSQEFLESCFCRDEWTAYYNRFSSKVNNPIFPLIIDDSKVPTLLSARKYAHCRNGHEYHKGLTKLLYALRSHEE